jgi:hypothetical protein
MNRQAVAQELVKVAELLVAESKPKVGDVIDMADQFGSDGKLYMPSYRFGLKQFVSWNEKSIGSGAGRSRQQAEQKLEDWTKGGKGDRWGYVFARPSGKVLVVLEGKKP